MKMALPKIKEDIPSIYLLDGLLNDLANLIPLLMKMVWSITILSR